MKSPPPVTGGFPTAQLFLPAGRYYVYEAGMGDRVNDTPPGGLTPLPVRPTNVAPTAPPGAPVSAEALQRFYTGNHGVEVRPGAGGTPHYVLWRRTPDHREHRQVIAQLTPVPTDRRPPLATARGMLFPLPFGMEVAEVVREGEGYALRLRQQPVGGQRAHFLYVPREPVDFLTPLTMEALQQVIPGAPPLDAFPRLSVDLPVFVVAAAPVTRQPDDTPLPARPRAPLFRPGERTNPDDAADGGSGLDIGSLDLGKLPSGAELCIVVDGSGSVGLPFVTTDARQRVARLLTAVLDPIPALFRGRVRVGVVVAQEKVTTHLPLTGMSGDGPETLLASLDQVTFQGATEAIGLGVAQCRTLLTTPPEAKLIQGIVVLTDGEGMSWSPDKALPTPLIWNVAHPLRSPEFPFADRFPDPVDVNAMRERIREWSHQQGLPTHFMAGFGDLRPLSTTTDTGHMQTLATLWDRTAEQLAILARDPGQRDAVEAYFVTQLRERRDEGQLQLLVAGLAFAPILATPFLPHLQRLAGGPHDEPLRRQAVMTIGRWAATPHPAALATLEAWRTGADDTLADWALQVMRGQQLLTGGPQCGAALLATAQRAPHTIDPKPIVTTCLLDVDTVKALGQVIAFGTSVQQEQAIQVLGRYLAGRGDEEPWRALVTPILWGQLELGLNTFFVCAAAKHLALDGMIERYCEGVYGTD